MFQGEFPITLQLFGRLGRFREDLTHEEDHLMVWQDGWLRTTARHFGLRHRQAVRQAMNRGGIA